MPKYVIERDIPGAGSVSDDEIRAISQKSNDVLADLGGDVQWLHSYVTDDKLVCVYIAPNEDRIREHATRTGIPANAVRQVVRVVDPTAGGA
jgi:Nickel responsive protein SCO4226-like